MQAGGKQLCCAGGVPVHQADDRQVYPALVVTTANDRAVAVLIFGVSHRALRSDQVDAADGIIQHAAAVVAQVEHKALRPAGSQGTNGIIQFTGRAAIELADLNVAHAVQHLIIHGGAGIAGVGQVCRFGGCFAVEPCHIDGRTGLALQAGLHSVHAGKALHLGAVNGGDVVPCHDAGLLCRRVLVDLGHLCVAGLVDAQLHANAHHFAALLIHQLRVSNGAVVAGVLVARAQQVASRQAVIQHCFVDGIVVVAAHIAIHLGHLVVHALLFLHAADGAVKQPHGDQHGDGKGHGHSQDHNGDGHAYRDLTVHALLPPVRTAASSAHCPAAKVQTSLPAKGSRCAANAYVFVRS